MIQRTRRIRGVVAGTESIDTVRTEASPTSAWKFLRGYTVAAPLANEFYRVGIVSADVSMNCTSLGDTLKARVGYEIEGVTGIIQLAEFVRTSTTTGCPATGPWASNEHNGLNYQRPLGANLVVNFYTQEVEAGSGVVSAICVDKARFVYDKLRRVLHA